MSRALAAVTIALVLGACGSSDIRGVGDGTPKPPSSASCDAVETTNDEGNEHIDAGKTVTYPAFPPASGPHDPKPLQAGIYNEPLSRQPSGAPASTLFRAVHSLEHGYVAVFVRDPGDVEAFRGLEQERKLIVSPASELDSAMVIVAWRRVQSCSTVNVEAVRAFIRAYREKTAPEPSAP